MTIVEFIREYYPALLSGTGVTILQFIFATMVAVALALAAGLMLLAPLRVVRWVATIYVEIFRGTSLLVQVYWFFFALPIFGLSLDKFTAGFVAVGMNLGAYGAMLVKGAIMDVPRGQWEAALALSMSPYRRMKRIILPQAIAIMLPVWGNLLIELLKATALVALISVADLMFQVRQINNSTFLSAQSFGIALVIYYILARFMVTPGMRWLERATARRVGRTAR